MTTRQPHHNQAIGRWVREMIESIAVSLAWDAIADYLDDEKQELKRNHEEIIKRLDAIQHTVTSIGYSVDEQILRDARAGVRELREALQAANRSTFVNEISAANEKFARLVELDPTGKTEGTTASVDNRVLIAVGHWGRHHGMNLLDEPKIAAIQVYECVAKYPDLGVHLFSPLYFSGDYSREILELQTSLRQHKEALARRQNENFRRRLGHWLLWGGRIGTAAAVGVAVGGVAAAFGGAGLGGVAGKTVFDALRVGQLELLDEDTLRENFRLAERRLPEVYEQLRTEAKLRLDYLSAPQAELPRATHAARRRTPRRGSVAARPATVPDRKLR